MKLFGGFIIGSTLGCGNVPTDCSQQLREVHFTGQCINAIDPVLTGNFIKFGTDPLMTREDCRDNCGNFAYFGLRNGNECYCGDDYNLPLDITYDAECSIRCPGDDLQFCGGQFRMNLWSRENSYLFADNFGDGSSEPNGQCYKDNRQNRILSYALEIGSSNMSLGTCESSCQSLNYKYYGVENGSDCYCGNTINGYPPIVAQNLCNDPCTGDELNNCGGELKMNLYTVSTDLLLSNIATNPNGQCYQDNRQNRILNHEQEIGSSNMSKGSCEDQCENLGYTYYGLENGSDCYCGNSINGNPPQITLSECNEPCTGNELDNCGGDLKMNLFTLSSNLISDFDSNADPQGQCYLDNLQNRILNHAQEIGSSNMSIGSCQGQCQGLGYKYYGLENGSDCYCGNSINGNPSQLPGSQCDMTCTGDDLDNCGGNLKMNLFTV